jgi:hypothetical protein
LHSAEKSGLQDRGLIFVVVLCLNKNMTACLHKDVSVLRGKMVVEKMDTGATASRGQRQRRNSFLEEHKTQGSNPLGLKPRIGFLQHFHCNIISKKKKKYCKLSAHT